MGNTKYNFRLSNKLLRSGSLLTASEYVWKIINGLNRFASLSQHIDCPFTTSGVGLISMNYLSLNSNFYRFPIPSTIRLINQDKI